jgi:hypothetical protein
LCPSSGQTLRLRLASEESGSDLAIRVTDPVITHTAPATATAIIRMALTGRIGPTVTILGGHTTTDTVIIAVTGIIATIGTKLM